MGAQLCCFITPTVLFQALVAVRCLSVWPLVLQYLHLMGLEQGAAHVNLGGNWRMPTEAEFNELINNTTQTWTTDYNGTGVKGYIVTSKTNGKSIFFPAAGYINPDSSVHGVGSNGRYWSSTWDSSRYACGLNFESSYFLSCSNYSRYCGYSVRGVCE